MPDEEAPVERTWPAVVKLSFPVQFGSERIETLTFQRGTLAAVKGLNVRVDGMPPLEQLMMIASRLCGQPINVIEKLDADDASEVLEIALGFFARCLVAGKTR